MYPTYKQKVMDHLFTGQHKLHEYNELHSFYWTMYNYYNNNYNNNLFFCVFSLNKSV